MRVLTDATPLFFGCCGYSPVAVFNAVDPSTGAPSASSGSAPSAEGGEAVTVETITRLVQQIQDLISTLQQMNAGPDAEQQQTALEGNLKELQKALDAQGDACRSMIATYRKNGGAPSYPGAQASDAAGAAGAGGMGLGTGLGAGLGAGLDTGLGAGGVPAGGASDLSLGLGDSSMGAMPAGATPAPASTTSPAPIPGPLPQDNGGRTFAAVADRNKYDVNGIGGSSAR